MLTGGSALPRSSSSLLVVLKPGLQLEMENTAGEAGPVGEGVAEPQYLSGQCCLVGLLRGPGIAIFSVIHQTGER